MTKKLVTTAIAAALVIMWVLFGLNSCSPNNKKDDKETKVTKETTKEEIKQPTKTTTKEETKEATENEGNQTNQAVAPKPKYYLRTNDQIMEAFGAYAGSITLSDVCDPKYFDEFEGFYHQVQLQIMLYQNQIAINKTRYENYQDFENMIMVYQSIETEMGQLIEGLKDQDLVKSANALKAIQVYYEQLVNVKGVIDNA